MERLKNVTLQEMLEDQGVRQREIADLLGLHESSVSLKFAGKREISLKEASLIATRLKTSIDQIFHAINFAKCKEAKNQVGSETSASAQSLLPKTG